MPIYRHTPFRPAWWLPGAHAQTIYSSLVRPRPALIYDTLRLTTPDGDFLKLVISREFWRERHKPIVFVFHGLEGSILSNYARGVFRALEKAGNRVVFMHYRNCGGELNRHVQSYYASAIEDPAFVIDYFAQRAKGAELAAVGYSIGGCILLNYLAHYHKTLDAAVAVSVPYDLLRSVQAIDKGFGHIYSRYLLSSLKKSAARKIMAGQLPSQKWHDLRQVRTLYGFDERFTAPIHGFASADDYYTRASCKQRLKYIKTPALLLHARNDPFMDQTVIPQEKELSPFTKLELYFSGGHVGFVSGVIPFVGDYWLEKRIVEFFRGQGILGIE